ncbi:MAG: excisionase family DNA-binding protein [Chitinophagaceae bacterium]
MEPVQERTSKEDQRIAKSSILKFRETSKRIINSEGNFVKIKIQGEGDFLRIPKKAIYLLFDILSNMAEGNPMSIIPSNTEVSTQQAADMLNVSRPHLVKLLEEGVIPFKKVGSHRRIELKNLVSYEKKLKKNRIEKLEFLTKQAQDLNLGY